MAAKKKTKKATKKAANSSEGVSASAIRILSAYKLVEAITVKKITATIFESIDFIKFLLFMIFYR